MKDDVKQDDLRIYELRAENFKRLSAITIRPDGSVIVISGRNGDFVKAVGNFRREADGAVAGQRPWRGSPDHDARIGQHAMGR